MGKIIDELRAEFQQETTQNIFGFKKYPKGDSYLYLGARVRDAEQEKRDALALAAATEKAALKIIGRYDPDAASDFYKEVQVLKERYLS